MTGHAGRYAAVMAAAAAAVTAVGFAAAGPDGRRGVVVGVVAALAVQGIAFWMVERPRARGGARLAAQAAGMVLRMAALLAVALWIAPRLDVPAVPTVLALGSVLFVGLTAEPLLYVLHRNQQR